MPCGSFSLWSTDGGSSRLNPRYLLLSLLWLSPVVAFPEESGKPRPNILWIVGENLKLDLGCYGATQVKTPALDGLAAEGQR